MESVLRLSWSVPQNVEKRQDPTWPADWDLSPGKAGPLQKVCTAAPPGGHGRLGGTGETGAQPGDHKSQPPSCTPEGPPALERFPHRCKLLHTPGRQRGPVAGEQTLDREEKTPVGLGGSPATVFCWEMPGPVLDTRHQCFRPCHTGCRLHCRHLDS